MDKPISRFHYLTQNIHGFSHEELAEIACVNGIRSIQLRVKGKAYDEWLQIAMNVKKICERYDALLIINDSVDIAKEINAHGVHLGKSDMPVAEARTVLGAEKIIGGTANTAEDVLHLQDAGADYIGLGPFRFTSTKENLQPVLGLKGYSDLTSITSIPIIAIGGITINDVELLMKSGAYGVAVSSAINLSEDKEEMIRQFLQLANN